MRCTALRTWATLVAAGGIAFLAAPSSSAQEPAPHSHDEIRELFDKVQRDLSEVDRLLQEAASSKASPAVGEAGAKTDSPGKRSARSAHERQLEVVRTIEKILDRIPPGG
jgi:hypothetical protein